MENKKGLWIYKLRFTEANPKIWAGRTFAMDFYDFVKAELKAVEILRTTNVKEIQIIRFMRDPDWSTLMIK